MTTEQIIILLLYVASLLHVYTAERKVSDTRRGGRPRSMTLLVGIALWPLSYLVWLFFGNISSSEKRKKRAEEWAKKRRAKKSTS